MKQAQALFELEPHLKQTVEAAKVDLETNRLFVSEEKARTWMRSLGTNQQAPRPIADEFIVREK